MSIASIILIFTAGAIVGMALEIVLIWAIFRVFRIAGLVIEEGEKDVGAGKGDLAKAHKVEDDRGSGIGIWTPNRSGRDPRTN